jgi:exonuclease III
MHILPLQNHHVNFILTKIQVEHSAFTGSNLKPHVKQKLMDDMGRWAGCIYQLKSVNITFLSVYHTVDNAYHGPTSIHAQQLAILLREARDVTPRQAWQQDIIESIHVLQALKVEVVIAGDFNTAEITRGAIKVICTQCNLEVISHASNGFSSYKQGTKCIDHVLGSIKIAQAVTLMRYEDYPAEYYSDHTPMFLQINRDTLRSSYGIGKLPRKRRLYSKDYENAQICAP